MSLGNGTFNIDINYRYQDGQDDGGGGDDGGGD
jgi:hypothetical protein